MNISTNSVISSRMLFCFSRDGAVLLHVMQKILLLSLRLSKFVVLPFGSSFIDDTI